MLKRSKRAWDWAEVNGGEKENDHHAFAAAMLLRATGENKYHAAFKKHSIFSGKQRYVTHAWHHLMTHSPAGIIPGLQSEAAVGRWIAGQKPSRSMGMWPAMSLYPPGPWPDLYKFSEDASPGMNEGVSKAPRHPALWPTGSLSAANKRQSVNSR